MDYSVANEKAVRFLSNSLKTECEVKNKLKSVGCEEEIINKVIDHLTNIHYIDDEKYVDAYIRQCRKLPKYSIFEIESKLKMKGICKDLLSKCREELDDGKYEKNIIDIYKYKHRNDDLDKVKAYLYRRGFKNINF